MTTGKTPSLKFERLEVTSEWHSPHYFFRSKIPGGWLIYYSRTDSVVLTFVPDPEHKWDGNSLP
jgi:hypothetical protein